jgi:hypothetical protein
MAAASAIYQVSVKEAVKLFSSARADDPAALEFLQNLWKPTDRCILCDREIGGRGGAYTHIIDDPRRPTKFKLLLLSCSACRDLPAEGNRRMHRMLSSIWPRARWSATTY